MDAVFRLTSDIVTPSAGTRLLKADDYSRLVAADALLSAAREQAQNICRCAEAAFEEQKKAGYEEGILEGRMAQSEKMLETALQSVEYLENLEQKLVGVVISAVRKIIGELDDKERIVRIVREALEKVRNQQKIMVRVCPAEQDVVRKALGSMERSETNNVNVLNVIADPRMKSGDCTLESELGVVEAGLEYQITAIERAMMRKIRES